MHQPHRSRAPETRGARRWAPARLRQPPDVPVRAPRVPEEERRGGGVHGASDDGGFLEVREVVSRRAGSGATWRWSRGGCSWSACSGGCHADRESWTAPGVWSHCVGEHGTGQGGVSAAGDVITATVRHGSCATLRRSFGLETTRSQGGNAVAYVWATPVNAYDKVVGQFSTPPSQKAGIIPEPGNRRREFMLQTV